MYMLNAFELKDWELSILYSFLARDGIGPDIHIDWLLFGPGTSMGTNTCRMEKLGDKIKLRFIDFDEEEENEGEPPYEFITSKENFINMINEWTAIREQNPPIIEIIIHDDHRVSFEAPSE